MGGLFFAIFSTYSLILTWRFLSLFLLFTLILFFFFSFFGKFFLPLLKTVIWFLSHLVTLSD